MPLYEYQCDACGHRFEIIQKMSDAPLETCPSCGGMVRKLQSAPAFQFKGTGWYVTDYARKESEASKTDGASKDGSKEAPDKTEKPADAAKPATSDTTSSAPATPPTPSKSR